MPMAISLWLTCTAFHRHTSLHLHRWTPVLPSFSRTCLLPLLGESCLSVCPTFWDLTPPICLPLLDPACLLSLTLPAFRTRLEANYSENEDLACRAEGGHSPPSLPNRQAWAWWHAYRQTFGYTGCRRPTDSELDLYLTWKFVGLPTTTLRPTAVFGLTQVSYHGHTALPWAPSGPFTDPIHSPMPLGRTFNLPCLLVTFFSMTLWDIHPSCPWCALHTSHKLYTRRNTGGRRPDMGGVPTMPPASPACPTLLCLSLPMPPGPT